MLEITIQGASQLSHALNSLLYMTCETGPRLINQERDIARRPIDIHFYHPNNEPVGQWAVRVFSNEDPAACKSYEARGWWLGPDPTSHSVSLPAESGIQSEDIIEYLSSELSFRLWAITGRRTETRSLSQEEIRQFRHFDNTTIHIIRINP